VKLSLILEVRGRELKILAALVLIVSGVINTYLLASSVYCVLSPSLRRTYNESIPFQTTMIQSQSHYPSLENISTPSHSPLSVSSKGTIALGMTTASLRRSA
jgi:hypothetical protein